MRITRHTTKDYENLILQCYIGARYLEDSSFNGEDDTEDGDLLQKCLPKSFFIRHSDEGEYPVRQTMERYKQDYVFVQIDLERGVVLDWPKGVTAQFYYKSDDDNYFRLVDDKGNIIHQTPENDTEYVIGPDFMNEYGDYFALNVNEDGSIVNWNENGMRIELQDWIDRANTTIKY